MGGRLSEWDVRQQQLVRRATFTDSYAPSLISVAAHPTQENITVTGSSSGILSVWDRRKSDVPTYSAEALTSPVWDVCFMPRNSTQILSADDEGVIRLWSSLII